jgi:hypothetical protein
LKKHKIRLYGKKATEEMIANEVSWILLGDCTRRLDPLSISDTARALGYARKAC